MMSKQSVSTYFNINAVRSTLTAYVTRPNGGLSIHWNFCIVEMYKFVFLHVTNLFFFSSQVTFTVALISLLRGFEF